MNSQRDAGKSLGYGFSSRRREVDLSAVQQFLRCQTPQLWLDQAGKALDLLLIDHANCEKKAASTALSLLYKYVDRPSLLDKLSRLAREELRHFEQVVKIMRLRGVEYRHLSPSRYAGELMAKVRKQEPEKLIDTLIVGALIEARSCERFAALIPIIDQQDSALGDFYHSLLLSESRHFEDYLTLAQEYSAEPIQDKVDRFCEFEATLIQREDKEIRFHSGPAGSEFVS